MLLHRARKRLWVKRKAVGAKGMINLAAHAVLLKFTAHYQEGETADKHPQKRRSEKQKIKRKGYDKARANSCFNVSEAFQWWRDLQELKGMKTDVEVALFLLDR